MRNYYEKRCMNIFSHMPMTFVAVNVTDSSFQDFVDHYKSLESARMESACSFRNLWIIKPGEDSNRGNGVYVMDNLVKIKDLMKMNAFKEDGERRSFILQKYIGNPLNIYIHNLALIIILIK